MSAPSNTRKGIRDVFYETRVLAGRDFTLKRFADEVLGASIDPVMLGYIEKGKRFPSEPLVRRLAAFRKQEPRELLALLWRDRMLHAFGKELRRVLHAPTALGQVDDIGIALLASQAIAALPDDESTVTIARWRREVKASAKGDVDPRRSRRSSACSPIAGSSRSRAARSSGSAVTFRRSRPTSVKHWRSSSARCSRRACSTSWRSPTSRPEPTCAITT